jgi:signal transduction histidine kinase
MQNDIAIDGVDTGLVLRTYAYVVVALGFNIGLWGPKWMAAGAPLHTSTSEHEVLIRIAGAVVFGAGLSARGLSLIRDPADRRRALGWFTAGHVVLFFTCLFQHQFTEMVPAFWWVVPGALTVGLYYAWQRAEGDESLFTAGFSDLFALFSGKWHGRVKPAMAASVRSQYEQQIRLAAAQEERHRLARDLHDSIKQQMFVIQTAAATAQTRLGGDAAAAQVALETVRDGARDAMTELEAMTDQLKATPLENAGLVDALKKQCEALRLRTGVPVDVTIGRLPPNEALPPGAQQAIFRVAQEALSNVARHARAAHVRVTLGVDANNFVLTVTDDGSGFDAGHPAAGTGLANMRARADEFGGRFAVTSSAGSGTTIRFGIPCRTRSRVDFATRAAVNAAIALGAMVAIYLANDGALLSGRGMGTLTVFLVATFETARYFAAWRRDERLRSLTA